MRTLTSAETRPAGPTQGASTKPEATSASALLEPREIPMLLVVLDQHPLEDQNAPRDQCHKTFFTAVIYKKARVFVPASLSSLV